MSEGTPLIAELHGDFGQYIKSLSKHARKDWRYVQKHNQDLTYSQVEFRKPDIEKFMDIWGRQTIHGNEPVRWAFDAGYVRSLHEKGVLRVFEARNDDIIAMHFVEQYGEYIEAHPPMYDKKHNKRYLAKYMWFSLMKWACENNIRFVDLGSGDRGTWRELLENRHQHPRIAYKWMYIADDVKNNPSKQPHYVVYNENGIKGIRKINR